MLSNCDNGYIPVTPLSLLKQRPIRKVQNIKSSYIVYMKKASNPLDINENDIPQALNGAFKEYTEDM